MNQSNNPRKWRGSPPVAYYAIILGALLLGALILGVQYGRSQQNANPSGATSEPVAGKTP